MRLTDFINTPCTLVHRVEVDTGFYQDHVETVEETVCEIQQKTRSEPAGEGQLARGEWNAYFLPGTTFKSGDVVLVGDHEYQVVGELYEVRDSQIPAVDHVEATLVRTAGPGDAS